MAQTHFSHTILNADTTILDIVAYEILDSRANPTIETKIFLQGGACAQAAVPSGASTGAHEAFELRDQDPKRYLGKGVQKAIQNINEVIKPHLLGFDAKKQAELDQILKEIDGTANKHALGANAILAVSLAAARAVSQQLKIPLFRYLGGPLCQELPVPLLNIINGGVHADSGLQIQEFMLVPYGMSSFAEALRAGVEIYFATRALLKTQGHIVAVGDEGGFAPRLSQTEKVLDLLVEAIQKAGYRIGEEVGLALDVAASEFFDEKTSLYSFGGNHKTAEELIEFYQSLCNKYPLVSLEDALAEDDFSGWKKLTQVLGSQIQLVGDDLFATHSSRLKTGIEQKMANAILIKPNQIGTLTETWDVIKLAQKSNYKTILSHRSGETEDSFLADLVVASGSGQIKTGAPCRGERTAKYNQLLRIEQELGAQASFAGGSLFSQMKNNNINQ